MTTEAEITVNGRKLTDAQSMTIRVALESFAFGLNLGEDAHGKAMTEAYKARIEEIRSLIFKVGSQ